MTRARTWPDLLLVAFAVALTGWGIHGLLQRDTQPHADRVASSAEAYRQSATTSGIEAPAAAPDRRFGPPRIEAARYLPPSGFDPEFRDPAGLDPDYALLLEELEAREDAEDAEAELYGATEVQPDLSAAELEALDDAELARELETYDAFLAEMAVNVVTR